MNPADLDEIRKALAPFLRFDPVRGAIFNGCGGTRLHTEDFARLRRVSARVFESQPRERRGAGR